MCKKRDCDLAGNKLFGWHSVSAKAEPGAMPLCQPRRSQGRCSARISVRFRVRSGIDKVRVCLYICVCIRPGIEKVNNDRCMLLHGHHETVRDPPGV
jgi:hypothetical protein